MNTLCIKEEETNNNIKSGLEILARIIVRDFIASQALALDGDIENATDNKCIQDK